MALSTEERMREGARVRREVLGAEHVDRGKQQSDRFYDHFTEFTTEHCWGNIWLRPGLDYDKTSELVEQLGGPLHR